jgi:hypothetical protein
MYTEKITSLILWAGYAFLGAFLSVFIRAIFTSEVKNWGGLFEEGLDKSHHLSRYALLFGTLILSLKFLIGVLGFESAEDIKNAAKLVGNFDINAYAGASGIAYLLSKSTGGNILSLFGRKS